MQNYKRTLYFIACVILVTLAIQIYWNYKNYLSGKQQLINEVQISLDKAVDDYYTIKAKKNTLGMVVNAGYDDRNLDTLFKSIDINRKKFKNLDSLHTDHITGISIFKGIDADSLAEKEYLRINKSIEQKKETDSIIYLSNKPKETFYDLAYKILVSFTEDTLQIKELDNLLQDEFTRKKLVMNYGLFFQTKDTIQQRINPDIFTKEKTLETTSKSSFLPKNSSLKLYFNNITATILKRNLLGILLSTLLLSAVIASLLFLLRIIQRQKQIAEVKNDLISNITHEFKTPIATIGVALEGMENFNPDNDLAKNKSYLKTSRGQLNKLTTMVEKLLETATLDGEELNLNAEEINLIELLQQLNARHKQLAPQKTFVFSASRENIWITADAFHLENALNNILDNAVKYGGDTITTAINLKPKHVIITITDNGKTLTKAQTSQLFEKFYRVPKGNTHDVKGFGIGLYYTKKIIEKHNGQIQIVLDGNTNFLITLPYA